MIFIVIILLIGIIGSFADDSGAPFGISIALSFIVLILLLPIAIFVKTKTNEKHIKSFRKEILSLDDSDKTSGSFFLGSGNINGYQSFTFYYKTEDGGYKRDFERAYNTTIYEDGDITPHIIYNKYKYISSWQSEWKFWLIIYGTDDNTDTPYKKIESIEIHVPQNTIIKEINLDNK